MAYTIRLHEKAHEEYIAAYQWYESQQKGLGTRFMTCVENCFSKINTNPELYTTLHKNFRQVKIQDFPYTVVYEFYPKKKLIHIAAIHHIRKNPKSRLRKISNQ